MSILSGLIRIFVNLASDFVSREIIGTRHYKERNFTPSAKSFLLKYHGQGETSNCVCVCVC